jgi:hypothetical protein
MNTDKLKIKINKSVIVHYKKLSVFSVLPL